MKNQAGEPKSSGKKKPWMPPENFKAAFTAALTRAGYDPEFRSRLTASCDSAKEAVSEEGDIDIPKEVVIVFHEHVSNDNYHVLHLPPFNEKGNETYEYEEYLDCCYNRFLVGRDGKFQNFTVSPPATAQPGQPGTSSKKEWSPDNASAAVARALTRAGRDGKFRNRLTASPDSAKQAVSEEGNINIPKEVVILFHEKKYNDDYHVFYLPDLKEGEPHETHEYRKHFQAAYHVW
jgi:hypothetical protein